MDKHCKECGGNIPEWEDISEALKACAENAPIGYRQIMIAAANKIEDLQRKLGRCNS